MNEIWIREGLLLLGIVLGAVLGSDTPLTQDVSLFFNP
jgi:hypothetical protein